MNKISQTSYLRDLLVSFVSPLREGTKNLILEKPNLSPFGVTVEYDTRYDIKDYQGGEKRKNLAFSK